MVAAPRGPHGRRAAPPAPRSGPPPAARAVARECAGPLPLG
jgi:hypothetical protein